MSLAASSGEDSFPVPACNSVPEAIPRGGRLSIGVSDVDREAFVSPDGDGVARGVVDAAGPPERGPTELVSSEHRARLGRAALVPLRMGRLRFRHVVDCWELIVGDGAASGGA